MDPDEENSFEGREFDINNLQNLSNFGADFSGNAADLAGEDDSDDEEMPGLEAA